MSNSIISIFILLLLAGGLAALQIFLSKKQNKWTGLILPAIFLIFSLITILGILSFSLNTKSGTVEELNVAESSDIISPTIHVSENPSGTGSFNYLITAGYVFLLSNIPTAILIGIYIACHEKMKRQNEIVKMNIQDLE